MDSVISTERDGLWDFEGEDFVLPGDAGLGRMQVVEFSSGVCLYRSEFRVLRECEIGTAASTEDLSQLLCSQMLLSGEVTMCMPDGQLYRQTAEQAFLFRVLLPGSTIRLSADQVIRHVGVAAPLPEIKSRLGDPLPEGLQEFTQLTLPQTTMMRTLMVQNRLRKLISEVFGMASVADHPTQVLTQEGMALSLYAEVLNSYIEQERAGELRSKSLPVQDKGSLWEQHAFIELIEYIRNSLAETHRAEDLASRFGLSKYRLYALFQAEFQYPLGEFLRRERLQKARTLLAEGVPVKAAAFRVGYNHVSNFSNAYRKFFGETPARTLRLNAELSS